MGIIEDVREQLRSGLTPDEIVASLTLKGLSDASARRFVERAMADPPPPVAAAIADDVGAQWTLQTARRQGAALWRFLVGYFGLLHRRLVAASLAALLASGLLMWTVGGHNGFYGVYAAFHWRNSGTGWKQHLRLKAPRVGLVYAPDLRTVIGSTTIQIHVVNDDPEIAYSGITVVERHRTGTGMRSIRYELLPAKYDLHDWSAWVQPNDSTDCPHPLDPYGPPYRESFAGYEIVKVTLARPVKRDPFPSDSPP